MMKGLQLAEIFFKERGLPMLQARFPELLPYLTAGLVGQGSECFGLDDEISRDHDWGASFCLWLPKEMFRQEKERLQEACDRLEQEYFGTPAGIRTEQASGRRGVLETENFYYGLIGCPGVPQKVAEWFYAPETSYACAANGKIFYGTESEFVKIRKVLQKGYPEDVRRKKIAARAVTMAQAGQYNYGRSRQRNNKVAAYVALSEFMKAACSMLHLLNHRYMPFYKWAYKSACALPVLSETAKKLERLVLKPQEEWIEEICFDVKEELKRQNLTDSDSVFLEPHGKEIMCRIKDEQIRSLPVLFG